MKRRKQLERTVPLKAGKPIGRSARRLPFRSQKRARLYREQRVPFVARILHDRPACQARLDGCTVRSTEVHETLTRARGGSIVDDSNVLALCHRCHAWITEHPAEAAIRGFVRHSWE